MSALRQDAARLQWWRIVCSNLCQPARLFHFKGSGFGRSKDIGRARRRWSKWQGHRSVRTERNLADSRWLTIADPDAPPPTAEPGLTALFREIRLTVSQEAQIIKAVFPNPSVVMQVFLQRVFAQVVSREVSLS